jgi:hypothetical protein
MKLKSLRVIASQNSILRNTSSTMETWAVPVRPRLTFWIRLLLLPTMVFREAYVTMFFVKSPNLRTS